MQLQKLYNVHAIWVVMVLLTLITYSIGALEFSGIPTVLFLLLTVLAKGVFIIRDFMELRGVSLLWRVIMYGWLWLVCIAIAVSYVVSAGQ
ncbi:MAG: cytochrome C oxidase subunit IV family protein [Granulosicoccus sp.]